MLLLIKKEDIFLQICRMGTQLIKRQHGYIFVNTCSQGTSNLHEGQNAKLKSILKQGGMWQDTEGVAEVRGENWWLWAETDPLELSSIKQRRPWRQNGWELRTSICQEAAIPVMCPLQSAHGPGSIGMRLNRENEKRSIRTLVARWTGLWRPLAIRGFWSLWPWIQTYSL